MRIVFMGTPDFSVPALEAVAADGHEIACVYTRAPKPKGRGQRLALSPVHTYAQQAGWPVRTPRTLRNVAEQENFAALKADVAVVAAYGLLLPKPVLEAPRYGCLNVHASLLPRWRGASPIQRAILAGDVQTGITIMQMDEGLDTGPMIARRSVRISEKSTAASLHDALAALGGAMIAETLHRLETDGQLKSEPQDGAQTTYAPLLTKEEGRIDWSAPAGLIDRQVRAFTPWPGAWGRAKGRTLKILEAEAGGDRMDELALQAPAG
ncbi:MAG TPA: methionyl-tRNA formyltransferase, partial [Alphaproteobacteria bacterium]|nr:methionyl-tRNA formyltransferase [Alphaproteobacteria bacterium]